MTPSPSGKTPKPAKPSTPNKQPEQDMFVEERYFEREKKCYILEDWHGQGKRALIRYTIPAIATKNTEDALYLQKYLSSKMTYAVSRIDTGQRESEVERLLVFMDTLAIITIPHFGEGSYASKLFEITLRRSNNRDRKIAELEKILGEATKYWYNCSRKMEIYTALYHRDIARKVHLKSTCSLIEPILDKMHSSLKEIRQQSSEIYFQNPD